MTLGTQNKKQVYFLTALGVFAAYMVYTNLLAGPDIPKSRPQQTAANAPAVPGAVDNAPRGVTRRVLTKTASEGFHPVYLDPNPSKRRDVRTIDPTLQLDKFAKVQSVELSGGARNVFQFSAAPPPPQVAAAKPAGPEPKISLVYGPRQPAPPPPPQPPPPPPPIPLKFYGYSTVASSGRKTIYLLDGDEIYLAAEGDTVKRRYKIVRIQPNSVVIEDLDAKRQQTVPLAEEAAA